MAAADARVPVEHDQRVTAVGGHVDAVIGRIDHDFARTDQRLQALAPADQGLLEAHAPIKRLQAGIGFAAENGDRVAVERSHDDVLSTSGVVGHVDAGRRRDHGPFVAVVERLAVGQHAGIVLEHDDAVGLARGHVQVGAVPRHGQRIGAEHARNAVDTVARLAEMSQAAINRITGKNRHRVIEASGREEVLAAGRCGNGRRTGKTGDAGRAVTVDADEGGRSGVELLAEVRHGAVALGGNVDVFERAVVGTQGDHVERAVEAFNPALQVTEGFPESQVSTRLGGTRIALEYGQRSPIAGTHLAESGHVKPLPVAAQGCSPRAEQTACLVAEAIVGPVEYGLQEAVGRVGSKAFEDPQLPGSRHRENVPSVRAEHGIAHIGHTARGPPDLGQTGLHHLHGLERADERLPAKHDQAVGAAAAGDKVFAVDADGQRIQPGQRAGLDPVGQVTTGIDRR